MPNPIAKDPKILNVPYVAPPELQQFVKALLADNQEMRTAIISLQSQINDLSRRAG